VFPPAWTLYYSDNPYLPGPDIPRMEFWLKLELRLAPKDGKLFVGPQGNLHERITVASCGV
jgi:hypothetical protein